MDQPDTLAAVVRRHRDAAALSQVALAGASGVSLTTIQRIEAGHDTTITVLGKLAAALGVELPELAIAPASSS